MPAGRPRDGRRAAQSWPRMRRVRAPTGYATRPFYAAARPLAYRNAAPMIPALTRSAAHGPSRARDGDLHRPHGRRQVQDAHRGPRRRRAGESHLSAASRSLACACVPCPLRRADASRRNPARPHSSRARDCQVRVGLFRLRSVCTRLRRSCSLTRAPLAPSLFARFLLLARVLARSHPASPRCRSDRALRHIPFTFPLAVPIGTANAGSPRLHICALKRLAAEPRRVGRGQSVQGRRAAARDPREQRQGRRGVP